LKQNIGGLTEAEAASFYRTYKELKPGHSNSVKLGYSGFYRTYKELKLKTMRPAK